MIRVLAVDPGESVGWARATIAERDLMHGGQIVKQSIPWLDVEAHGIAYLKDMAQAIYKAVVVEDRYDVIVYETFLLTAKGARVMVGSDLQTAQFVGMVRLCAWLNGRVVLVPQGPAAMSSANKSVKSHPSGDDIQARLAKLPKSHDESHDGSALRHLWTYFFERYV